MSNCLLCMEKSSGRSLHAFPLCPKKRQIWLKKCGLTNEDILPNRKICSLHFNTSCFKSNVMRCKLYPDSVPTIFKRGQCRKKNPPLTNVKDVPVKSSKMSTVCLLCSKPASGMSLHKIPKCPKIRQIWLNNCGFTNEEVLPNSKICSYHFKPTCFKSNLKRRLIYPDAVPTIFKSGQVMKNPTVINIEEIPKPSNQNVFVGQNCEPCDTAFVEAFKENKGRAINIINNLKAVNDKLDVMINKLRTERESLRIEMSKLPKK